MRALLDTNIVLDFLLQREPFFQDTEQLFEAIVSGKVVGHVTATTLTDIFYIARRHTHSIDQARQAVSATLTAMEVCPIDRAILEAALTSQITDFEDAVQIFSSVAQRLDAIVTRDTRDFANSPVPVLSVQELLLQVGQ